MSGFEFVNMADYGLMDEKHATDLFPYYSHEVITMMNVKNIFYDYIEINVQLMNYLGRKFILR